MSTRAPEADDPDIATFHSLGDVFRVSLEDGDVLAATLRWDDGLGVSGEAMSISPAVVAEPRVRSTVKTLLSWNGDLGSMIGAPLVDAPNDWRRGALVVFPSEMSAETLPLA